MDREGTIAGLTDIRRLSRMKFGVFGVFGVFAKPEIDGSVNEQGTNNKTAVINIRENMMTSSRIPLP